VWKACERFNLLPPGIKKSWDNNTEWHHAMIIGYNQIREHEEMEMLAAQAGSKIF
jgi:hypothetical protein